MIKFLTDGMMLREISEDFMLKQYQYIILDEAHERNLNQDILIAFLREILTFNSRLKLVIMSATIHVSDFVKFFSIKERGITCD